jgi:hypothetical protein
VVSYVARELIDSLWSAVMLPFKVLSYTSVIDNKFSVLASRAQKAGVVLAKVLQSR